MVSRLCTIAAFTALFAAHATAKDAPTSPTQEQIRAKVTQRIPYRCEDEIQFSVAEGQAVALQFQQNPYSLEDFLIYPDENDLIRYVYGDVVTANLYREKGRDKKGSVRQLGELPCVAIIQWTIQGHELKISFCLTADKQKIAQAVDRTHRERGQWASRFSGLGPNMLPPTTLPEAERIAGFVRLWSEVKYNFVFFDKVPDLNWDKVLDEYLPRVQKATTDVDYYKVLRQCMALLHDGHSNVWGPSNDPSAAPPVRVAPVGGKAVVVAALAPEKLKDAALREEYVKAGLKIGDEITRIDGQPVSQFLREKLYPYICASTPQSMDLKAYRQLLSGEPGSKVRLTVRSLEGTDREFTLTRGQYSLERAIGKTPDGELKDGIFYVELSGFEDKDLVQRFKELMPGIRQSRGLILDVRNNGGGDDGIGNAIISQLTAQKLAGSHWKTRLYRPAFRAWGRPEGWEEGDHSAVTPAKDPYLGPVVVLTGPATFSAAEDFLVVLKYSGRAKLVGEATGGSTGQPLMIEGLPGGGGARVCTKRDTFPDGTDFVGVGVIPDVEVHPTPADIAAGRDAVLEKAIEIVKTLPARAVVTSAPEGPDAFVEQIVEKLEGMAQVMKKRLTFDDTLTPGVKSEFELKLNQSGRLKFPANNAGMTEMLYRYESKGLQIVYSGVDGPFAHTEATIKKPREWRICNGNDSKDWMHCTNDLRVEGGKAYVTFIAKPMTQKELDEHLKRQRELDREKALNKPRQVLEWDEAGTSQPVKMMIPGPDDANLTNLRKTYNLDKVVAGAADDYEKVRRLLKWTHDQWKHNGDNTPSHADPLTILAEAAEGKQFRCVEYAITVAGCAQAMGLPARVLALKRQDVETAQSGAGHVVAEVWLPSLKKWVFVDGQWDAIPEKDGVPLNAVEFQEAFAKNAPSLKIQSSSQLDVIRYLLWVTPYLYYFDFNVTQNLFGDSSDHGTDELRYQPKNGKIMLVPKGAKKPTVFQRKTTIENCTYISNPKSFYPEPDKAAGSPGGKADASADSARH